MAKFAIDLFALILNGVKQPKSVIGVHCEAKNLLKSS